MATIDGLRQRSEHVSHLPGRGLLVLLSLLVVAALSAAFAASISHRPTEHRDLVSRALGPGDPTFLADRRWDRLTHVSVGHGIQIRRLGSSIGLAAQGAGSSSWTPHAWGLDRKTPFGRQALVMQAPRTEEYLTVDRPQGSKTWRWVLDTRNSLPRLEVDGTIGFGRSGVRILPPVVFDPAGRDVTPAGTRWALDRRGGRTILALHLDDRGLPSPYVIDPIAIVGSPGQTGSTKTGSPLVINKPTGVATGNLMVATVSLRDATATVTPPAGWTLLTSIASSTPTTNQLVYTKVAAAGEPTSYTWTWASGSGATDSSGVILAYSGIWAGAGSNIDTSTTATADATTSAATAAGTAAYAQDLILALYGTAGSSTFTTPTGMNALGTVSSQSGSPAVRSSSGTFDMIQAASGAIAAETSTITNRDMTAVMVAVRPAAAAASASLSTVSASPTSVLADGSTTSTITATIKDANGNPLSGKTVTLAKSGGSSTITTVSGTTDAAGAATFTVKDSAVESTTYTATDSTDAVTVTQTAAVTFTAGPVTAAQSTVSAAPASVSANGVATSTVTVTLKDAQSHPISGKTVTLAKSGGSSTITTVTGVTNASGQATFTVKDTVAESTTYTATDTTDSVVVTQTAAVTFTAGPVTAAQSTVSASPASVVADGATTSTVTVTLKDANSNPVSGKTVTLAKSGGSSTITTVSGSTNASGQATFTVKDSAVESTTYTATDTTDTITVTQTASVSFTAGPVSASTSTVTSSPGSVTANGSTSSTITVTAKDSFSHLLSGQTVTLAQGAGSSSISPASATTNASGVATFTVTATATQTVTYTATVASTTVTQTASVTFTPGAATHFTVTGPASATAGVSFNTLSVTALDANNNVATGYTGTVTFSGGGTSPTLPSNYTFVAGDSGVHTFTATLKQAGARTITATDTVTGTINGTSGTITVNAASAATLTVAGPASATAGVSFNTLTVTAKDAFGNTATGYTGTVAFSGGGTSPTLPSNYAFVAGDNGTHTFTATLTQAGSRTVTATDTVTGTITGTSGTITVGAAAASSLTVAGPASATAGVSFNTLTVTAKDTFGNTATGYTGTVTFSGGGTSPTLPSNYAFVAGDNGTHTFSATLTQAGARTITATDTVTGTITGSSGAITVNPAGAATLTVTGPASATAGVSFNTLTVTAKDAFGNTATGYTGTVTFSGGGTSPTLPSNYAFVAGDNGTHTFTATLTQAGARTITATDTVTGTITGTSGAITVGAAAAGSLTVAGPASTTAGVSFNTLTVTAKDVFGNTATGYTGTVTFSGGGSSPTLPSNYTFVAGDNGTHTFTATLTQVGARTITATDTVTGSITGTSGAITVNPAGAATLTVTGPASATAGASFNTLTITAKDAFGNTATGYTGTVSFSGGGTSPTLPSNYTFVAGDNGTHTFSATLTQAGARTITATDTVTGTITGTTGTITVNPAGAATLTVAGPASATAGVSFNTLTVTAKDTFGNTATGYTGTVTFSGGGTSPTLPSNYTFVAGDNGTHTFTATLKQAGARTITATDTVTGTITGTSGTITVGAAAASSLTMAGPASATAGVSFNTLTVTAKDAFGNTATGYTGTVGFSGGGTVATLPANYAFVAGDNGTHTFSATLTQAGARTITATDTVTGTITGTTGTITVNPAGAATLTVTGPASATAGVSFNTLTVTAKDAFGNTATGYTGAVAFSGGGTSTTLPSNYTFVAGDNGTHTFSATLTQAGARTITATDTVTGTITGTTGTITVNPAGAATLTVNGPASATAGVSFNTLTVTAKDTFGNTATGYTGTVAFSGGGTSPTLPSNYTFVGGDNGTHTFSATLTQAGARTITVTDTVTGSITGATGTITVNPASAATLTVTGPASATAGVSFNTLTVTAKDAFGNTATGYTGTVGFSGGGTGTTLPSNYTFVAGDNGTHTFNATLTQAGPRTITATDTVTGTITGTTGTITVNPAGASTLTVTGPASATAGVSFNTLTVTAKDAFGNTATGYTGTVGFSGGGTVPTLPGNYTFVAGDNGTHTFSATLTQAGARTITATDTVTGSITGATGTITVNPAGAATLTVSGPASATAGVSFNTLTVTAKDAFGNTATGYTGTVGFSGGGTGTTLPSNYTFVAGDNGTHTFNATLTQAGARTITATDTVTGSITGTTGTITVNPAAAATLTVSAPASRTAGSAFSATVTAKDAFGNTATGYAGTVGFSSTDAQNVLPSNYTFVGGDSGTHTFTNAVTFKTAGTQTLTATDTVTGSITGTSGNVTVTPAALASFAFSLVSPQTNTGAFGGTNTLTARDAFGNTVTSFNAFGDTVTITAAAPLTGTVSGLHGANVLNLASDFVNGVADLTSLGLTYTGNAATGAFVATAQTGETGTSSAVTIAPAAAASFTVTGSATQTAGQSQTVTVTARDVSGNVATGYTGDHTVTFSGASAIGSFAPTVTSKTGAAVALGTGETLTFTNGVATAGGSMVLYRTETANVAASATDGGAGGTTPITASGAARLAVAVAAAGISTFDLTATGTTPTAGNGTDLTITARDPFGNVATSYTGDHALTFGGAASSSAPATAPTVSDKTGVARAFGASTTLTFTNGVASVSGSSNGVLTLYKAQSAQVTVDDGSHNNGTGTSFAVGAAAPAKLAVTSVNGGSTATAGIGFDVDVTAEDAYGNPAGTAATTGFALSLAAGTGTLGGTLTGTIASGQSQTTVSGVTYTTAETGIRITATRTSGDTLAAGTSAAFAVAASADRLVITSVNGGSNPTAGSGFSVVVQAQDAQGNSANVGTATGVTVSLDTGTGTLGGTLTGTISAGQGQLTLSGVTYTKAEPGVKLAAARTSGDALLAALSSPFTVDAGAAAKFVLNGSGTQTAGDPNQLTITALDANGNIATSYNGDHSVTFSGALGIGASNPTVTDKNGAAVAFGSAAAITFTNGVSSAGASMVLVKAASANVVATAGSVTTTGADRLGVTVSPAATSALAVTTGAGGSQTAGAPFDVTVTAHDVFGNTTPTYTGTVDFSSNDGAATLPASYAFAAGDNGAHTFTGGATLSTAGSRTVTATDHATPAITGTTPAITVTPAATDHLVVTTTASAPQTAGTPFDVAVTAKDSFGNTTPAYTGTVDFTSTDAQALLPASYQFTAGDNGTKTFAGAVTLKTAGAQTVSAADHAAGSISGSAGVSVGAASATTLTVTTSAGATQTAGTPLGATVTAKDAFGNVADGYTDTVHFSSTDAQASLPADYTFTAGDAGSHAFAGVTLASAGVQALTATATGDPSVTGTSPSVNVTPAAATKLIVTGSATQTAGTTQAITVRAVDAYANTATAYTGAHDITFSGASSSPAPLTAPTVAGTGFGTPVTLTFANGVSSGNTLALYRVETANVAATDGAVTTTGADRLTVAVAPAAADRLALTTTAGASQTAGAAFSVTLTALDAFGNTATGYTGGVTFSSTDAQAGLPVDYTFAAGDNGTHTFPGVVLKTAGSQTVGATDTVLGSISGTTPAVSVTPAATTALATSSDAASPQLAGQAFSVTVTAKDTYGNTTPAYAGTVHLASSDAQSSLPADYTFVGGDNGTHVFAVTLKTAGAQTVSTDDGSSNGSTNVTVAAAAADHFTVTTTAASPQTAGGSFSTTVTARDAFGNVAIGYRGTVHFTSGDAQASLPSDYSFTAGDNGAHTFTGVVLKTAGSRGVAAADGGVSGSATVSVAPAATTHLDVTSTAGSPQTAGGAFALTVTAQDDFGNTTPAYTGAVHLQSDDAQAVLPADYAFVAGDNGSHSFPVVLRTAGARAAGAVDTGDASIAGTTAVTVAAAAADHLTITTDAANPQTAGDAASATVTARDAYGNVDTAYTGTVSFTSNDAVATVPGDYAFTGADAGTHTFTGGVTFRTVGARTVSAADAAHGTISGTSPVVTVGPAAISSFRVTATSTAPTAGVADALTITALDPFGNVATGYTGDHVLVFDGAQASTAPVTQPTVTDKAGSAQALGTPATVTFTNGVSSAGGSLVAYKAETAMVTVDDGAHSNGAGLMLHVAPAGATKLAIDVNNGMTPTAGSPFPVIGTALDDFGNASAVTAPTDVQVTRNAGTGTVGGTLTGTIPLGASQVTLGGVTYSKAEGGVQLTLARTSGDNLVSADSATFTVSSIADRLVVATVNGGTTPSAGTPFSVVVRAEDANHNASTPVVDTTFALSLAAGTGTLGGTLTGTLPAGQTQVTVSGLTYTKAEGGVQLAVTRTAGDTLLAGTSATFAVAPGAANRFAIVGSGTQTAGTPNQLTITAYDANGNIATGYAGAHALTFGGANSLGAHAATVTDNGGSAVDFGTPATITFTNGVSTAGGSLVLYRVENAIVTATAGAVSTTGSDRLPVAVDSAATATLDVASSASSPQTAGAAFDVTVTARDTYGNLTPAYVGGVTFTSNDAQAVLPGAFTFGAADNGTHTFTGVTLKTAGTKTVTVTDSGNATITGSASATVAPAGASALRLTGSPTQTAGTAQTVTVTVLDQFGNTATAYTGGHAVTFAGAADSPSPATHPTVDTIALGTPTTLTFTNGTATGSLKLFAAGNPTLTATAGALTTTGSDRLGVSVAHAALAKLALTLSSPQVNGAAFTGANTIAAEDPYGNIVDSFDAATDNVTLTTSGGLTGTLSGADVLSHAGDFVSGIADLSSLGLTYTGAAATGTLQAATQSGSTGSATLTVTGGTATKLVVTGSGTETAGQAQQLTITAQDASGNTSQSYTGDHALTFGGASAAGATQPTVSDKNGTAVAFGSPTTTTFTNGVASAGGSLTLYKAENAVVTATDGALTTTGSDRLAVSITAAQPSGSASAIAAAPASRTADGTSASTVTVTARDTFGNPLTTGGATVVFNTDRGSLGATTDNNNGTYSGSLTSTTAGTAHVTATIDAGAVAGSATVTFLPDTVSASHTTVVASSGTASTDGGTATITVTVKDANDNAVANAHVTLDQGAGTSAGISPTPLAGADTDANGVATFTVSDTVAEAAVFSATASSLLVTQTAGVTFLPGTANAGHSLLSATPLSLVAGSSSAITVRARDAHDNDLTSGGASVVLATTLGSIGAVTDHGNGTYTATLTSTSAGTADVTGTIDGAPIGAAAVHVAFDPGAADASQTTISASPSTINADGSSGTSTITARAKDAYGNDLATGGATVTLATTKGSLGSVTDNGNGTYSATLTATGQSGTAHVTGQLGGTAIGGAADVTLTPPVPVVAIDGGIPAGQTTASTVTVTFHSPNDDGNTTFDCRLDGGAFAPCVSPKTYSGLADGSHTFRVRGVNGNGAGVAVSGSWTVDSTGPTVHVTTAPGAYTNNVTETLAATASDATTSVAGVDFLFGSSAATCPAGTLISTDTTPNGAGEYTATWTTPADGSYAVCAVAHDPLGNASAAPDTSAVVVDRTKPVASLPAFGTVVGPTTYVRGNRALHASALDATSGVDTVDFSFSGATSGSIDHLAGAGTPNTNDSYDTIWNTTALADGPYTVALIARDKATNADTQTRDIVVDNTAPSISVDDPGAFGNGTISLSVTASDAGSGLDSSSIVVESSPHGAATWTPIADPAAWTPADGNYDLRATAKDNVGNQATSATRTILVDNTAPTVSDDADSAWHNTDVTVTLGAADAESGVASVEYKVDGAGSWTTGTAVTIPSTAGDGPHTITYRATNRAGVASTPRTATVKIDASTPSAGQPVVAPIATYARGTIDLSATVSDAASGIASGYPTFRIAPAATPETTPASNCPNWGSAAPAHFDTTSVADGNYALRTIAVDNATNGICSSVATATSLTIDNTAPATVAQNVPLATQNQDVTVTLDATDNLSGVQSTEYRVDHGPWTTGTTVVIPASSNHSNDGLHTIDYFSTDRAGNAESAQTAQVAIDTTGPSGSATDPSNILTGTVLLTASPTEPDIKTVQWLYRPTGSTGAYTPVGPADTAAPWQTNWITSGVFDGDYDLEVVFTDTTGNQTTQALSTKTIDNTAPDSATVTAPVANAVRSGTIALGSTAHDATSGIDSARTQFEVKATGDSAFVPVSGTSWNSTTKPDGPVQVHVAVWDRAGNGPIYSSPVTFTVDNTAPTVSLSAPAVAGTSASLSATGSADIATVDFEVSPHGAATWTHVATANGPFTATWTPGGSTPDGLYDVRATATDLGSHTGTDVKTVRVDQTAPTGSIAQPAAGTTVGGPDVVLHANADGTGSSVADVKFQYRALPGGTFVDAAGASTPPFKATWNTTALASGDYELRAIVTDAAGNTFTSAATTVTVDSTPPGATFTVQSPLHETADLSLTTADADATSVVYAVSPAGAGTWTQIASSTHAPDFGGSFATGAFADGDYDVRATISDGFGNTTQKIVPNVRIDNTAPALASSTPADGSMVASANSISAVATEPIASITALRLDTRPVTFTPTLSGAALTFPTGPLAPGEHVLRGWLVDVAGNSMPFRINITVGDGSTTMPATSKNVSTVVPTTLTSVDNNASVIVPTNVWQQPVPTPQDFLVLHVQPVTAATVATGSMQAQAVVDVRMTWDLTGEEEHHFDAPLQVDLSDPTGGRGVPATTDGGDWRMIQQLDTPGTLPASWQDGYWRENGLVHILTRHLSQFAILDGTTTLQLAPPRDFAGAVATDGLTLRWAAGIPDDQLASFSLYANGTALGSYGPREYEAKLGQVAAENDVRYTLTETNTAGNESDAVALRVAPPVAGLGLDAARAALAARGFKVGKVTTVAVPTVAPGTVVGPTAVSVQPEGTAIDLQVAGTGSVRSGLAFSVANAPRMRATSRTVFARVLLTAPARVDVTLDAKPYHRIQRWHFLHVPAGASVLRLHLAYPLPAGGYDLYWMATADADKSVQRELTPLQNLGKRARLHVAGTPQIVTVADGRHLQAVDRSHAGHVETLSSEETFVYATFHDVSAIVVDADREDVAIAASLRTVFPGTATVVVSTNAAKRSAAARAGALTATPATLASVLRRALSR